MYKFFYEKAWICARQTTHHDLASQRHENVNLSIRARPTTHHDLVSVIPEEKREREREKEQREKRMRKCKSVTFVKDGMSAALAGSQKADEEDCKTDHAPRVAATENEEVATLTATIETNLRQGDLVTGVDSPFRDSHKRGFI